MIEKQKLILEKKLSYWFFHLGRLVVLVLILAFSTMAASAEIGWSEPLLLYSSEYHVSNPLVIDDVAGRVHVFWIEEGEEGEVLPAIFHRQLDEYGWSEPISVLTSPDQKSFGGLEVAADIYGRMQAIWHGQNNTLYYSQVVADDAHDPRSWSEPEALENGFIHAGITTDEAKIHIAYPGTETQGVYYIYSEDGGISWSATKNISKPSTSNSAPDYVQIAVWEGIIHVVWTEFRYPDGYPVMGVFYAKSDDGGVSWSEPIQMAREGYDQISVRADLTGGVHVVWNGAIEVGGRYHRVSFDGGNKWSEVDEVIPAGLGGTSGYPQIDFDSANGLHFATTIDWQGGIQYAYQQGTNWYYVPGLSSGIDYESYEIKSIELPRLAISHGNRLHLVYEVGFEEIYYQETKSSAQEIEPAGAEMLPAGMERVHQATPTLEVEAVVPEPTLPTFNNKDTGISVNPSLPILIGAGTSVACIVLITILFKRGRRP